MPRFSVLLFLLALLTLQHVRVGANNRLLRKRNLYDVDMDEHLQERDLSQIWQEASQQLSDAQKKRLLGKKTSKSDGGNVSDYSSGKGKGSKKVSYSLNGKEGGKGGKGDKKTKTRMKQEDGKGVDNGSGKGVKRYQPETVVELLSMSMEFSILF